jgi:hypothetical protein
VQEGAEFRHQSAQSVAVLGTQEVQLAGMPRLDQFSLKSVVVRQQSVGTVMSTEEELPALVLSGSQQLRELGGPSSVVIF